MNSLTQTWFIWAGTLAIGFPLSIIVLSEIISLLARRSSALVAPLQSIRNLALPALALMLFTQHVFGLSVQAPAFKLIATLFWVSAIYAALSLLNALLFEETAGDSWRANVPALFLDLSRFILILLGIAIVMSSVWGTDLGGLLTALGVGSIVIGLALQDTLSNIFSGISILFERPYSEGDWIEVNGTVAKVDAINWRATRLQNRDGDSIIIPNSIMASSTILNESKPPGAGYEDYLISFSYDDPPNKVKAVMLDTIKATQGVLETPAPMVRTLSYDDSSISYQVRFALDDYGQLPNIKDDFASRIWYAAQRHGLNIPFPIRTVYHADADLKAQKSQQTQLTNSLEQLSQFIRFDETDSHVAQNLSVQHFGKGEQIIEEGDVTNALYVILTGTVSMNLEDPQGQKHLVSQLANGELFGGAALLRGQASSSAFTALSDVSVISLSNDIVMALVEQKPSFARELEELIELRSNAEEALKLSFLATT